MFKLGEIHEEKSGWRFGGGGAEGGFKKIEN
jgi:hypothetical protein